MTNGYKRMSDQLYFITEFVADREEPTSVDHMTLDQVVQRYGHLFSVSVLDAFRCDDLCEFSLVVDVWRLKIQRAYEE